MRITTASLARIGHELSDEEFTSATGHGPTLEEPEYEDELDEAPFLRDEMEDEQYGELEDARHSELTGERYLRIEPEWEAEFDGEHWTDRSEPEVEFQVAGGQSPTLLGFNHVRATLGFEFDINYGFDREVVTARSGSLSGTFSGGAQFPGEGSDATTKHKKKDKDNAIDDGFDTSRDGPRMEIATAAFFLDSKPDFDTVVANVIAFATELETAAKAKKPDTSITSSTASGHPIWFEHSRTTIGRFPLVVVATGSGSTLKYPSKADLWASPQATITLPLRRIGMLIDEVVASAGRKGGAALTGTKKQRLGLRSDLARDALAAVKKSRTAKISSALSDGTTVSASDYSDALVGFVTLMVMYFMTSEVIDAKDYERFAKAYLPINLKTPFRHVFKFALTERERFIFMELYGNKRVELYKLAKTGATASTGQTRLFPPKAHGDIDRFHATAPTWDTLIDHVAENKPNLVTKRNIIPKKNHALGDEILMAPISSKIDWCSTEPRIAVELRRIGHVPVPLKHWKTFMTTARDLAVKLNA